MSRPGITSKPHLLSPVLALVVILPLFRFTQGPGADALRMVDFVSLYASGIALGAMLVNIVWSMRRGEAR